MFPLDNFKKFSHHVNAFSNSKDVKHKLFPSLLLIICNVRRNWTFPHERLQTDKHLPPSLQHFYRITIHKPKYFISFPQVTSRSYEIKRVTFFLTSKSASMKVYLPTLPKQMFLFNNGSFSSFYAHSCAHYRYYFRAFTIASSYFQSGRRTFLLHKNLVMFHTHQSKKHFIHMFK